MARTAAATKEALLPSAILPTMSLQIAANDASRLVPETLFSSLSWWDKLSEDEKVTVHDEGIALAQALLVNGASRMAVGEHLTNLQGTLEPHNLFGRFLKVFKFSKRTAYRYISGYKNAKARLPEPILKAAMARGINMLGENDQKPLGVYTDAVKRLPPPQNANAVQANTWLDSVEEVRVKTRQEAADAVDSSSFTMPEPTDPQTAMKECYRFVVARYKKLPSGAKVRTNWVRGFVGMLLTELGVSAAQSFLPQAVPDDFRVQRGRPAQKLAEA